MAGTIPTVVYFGLGLLSATWFYPATAIVCGLVGLADRQLLDDGGDARRGLRRARPAGRSRSGHRGRGRHLGRLLRRQDDAGLGDDGPRAVHGRRRDDQSAHRRDGLDVRARGRDRHHPVHHPRPDDAGDGPGLRYGKRPGDACRRVLDRPPQPAADGPARHLLDPARPAVPGDLQLRAVRGRHWRRSPSRHSWPTFVGKPGQGPLLTGIEATYAAMANGFVSATGNETIDTLFSRGGMSGMLTTIWLILGALSYAAIMEEAGFLDRLIRPIVARAKSTGRLIAAVIGTCIGLNIIAGDQYVAIVMPSRVYRAEFARRGIAPRMLSRAVEDSGTVTSPLVPWNSCGAYMAAALGVATLAYLPFCFFNLASPLISLLYGFTGFRIERVQPTGEPPASHRTSARRSRSAGGRPRMTAATNAETPSEGRRGFALPSAYTILFILIVITAIATWIIPAGAYDLDPDGEPIPGTLPPGRSEPAADRRRLVDGPDQRALRDRRRGRQHQRLELRRTIRGHRRRPVHPRDRRLPRRDDEDRRDPGRDRADRRAAQGP